MNVHSIIPRTRGSPSGPATHARPHRGAHARRPADHMGYPYNLAFRPDDLGRFGGYLVNNLGDPYAGSHYGSEVCALEREVVAWFERLWECDGDGFWGSVGASGTEGNLWALYLGREALPGAVLLHSDDAHYSIPKAGRILGMETRAVRARPRARSCLTDLAAVLAALGGRPVVLALTCGTTMKGAHDDIAGATRRAGRRRLRPRPALRPRRWRAQRHGHPLRRATRPRRSARRSGWRSTASRPPATRWSARPCPAASWSRAGRMSSASPRRSAISAPTTRR